MENKEIRILLNEAQFSQVVKIGRIVYVTTNASKTEFPLSSMDVREMCNGKILIKKVDDQIFEIAIAKIDKETIKEILKRTPLYSSLAEEIN